MENWQFPLYVMEKGDDLSLMTMEEAVIAVAKGADFSGDVVLATRKIRALEEGEVAEIRRRARHLQTR